MYMNSMCLQECLLKKEAYNITEERWKKNSDTISGAKMKNGDSVSRDCGEDQFIENKDSKNPKQSWGFVA